MNDNLLTSMHLYNDEDDKLIDIEENKRKHINEIYICGFNNKLSNKYEDDYSDEFIINSNYISYIKRDSDKTSVLINYKIEINLKEFYSIEKIILDNPYYHKTQSGLIYRDYNGRYSSYQVNIDYFDSCCYLNKSKYFDFILGNQIKTIFKNRGIVLPLPSYIDFDKSEMKKEYGLDYYEVKLISETIKK